MAASSLLFWQYSRNQDIPIVQQNAQILQDQTDSLETKNQVLRDFIQNLTAALINLQFKNDILAENSIQSEGIFFDVVVGDFEDFNLSKYFSDLTDARKENYKGRDKLVIGRFRSFKKALLFENDLKRLGLESVELIGFVDGKIVPYQEALQRVQLRK